MSEVGEQKDLLIYLQENITPTIIAIGKTLEPFIQFIEEHKEPFIRFIEEHKETIELWVQFAAIYPKLELYIDNISKGLNDPDFEIANDVVKFAHILDAIDLEKSPEAITIMSVISSELFQKSVNDFYLNSCLDKRRLPLIQEAMLLHKLGYYGGSICLLYGLIEGVLTESFIKNKYIFCNNDLINPISHNGTVNSKKNLTGIVAKLDHAISYEDPLKTYYQKIKSYKLVSGESGGTISKTRNSILHGGSVDFNKERRSAQLLMWLYSVLLHVDALGFNNSFESTPQSSSSSDHII